MEAAAKKRTWSWMAFGASLVGTMLVLAGLEGGAVAFLFAHDEDRPKRGWVLVEAVVAAQDLAEGHRVAATDLAVRKVPEQVVTASVLRPADTSKVIGRKLQAPLQAGDWLTFGSFNATPFRERCLDEGRREAAELGVADDADVVELLRAIDADAAAIDTKEAAARAEGPSSTHLVPGDRR